MRPNRSTGLVFLVAGLAGCGGGTTPTPPPPPPSVIPGAPASVTVSTGDNQEAEPGKAVAVAVAVIVRDVAGRAVPNVVVTFAVDSGGGSVAAGNATTGSDGTASPGTWTLGPAEGPNVLRASTGSLSARVRARAVLPPLVVADRETIGAGGGTIAYRKPGDPLDGLAITVPAGAYPTGQRWSIAAKRTFPVPLPSGVRQIGGAFLIGNDQGYADSMVALRLPVRVGLDTAVSALIYDAATGYLEGMSVASRDTSGITVLTRHVAARFLWKPRGPNPTRVQSATAATFDSITVIAVALPPAAIAGDVTTGFAPGVDDWEFTNYGAFPTTGGNCAGMSITAMYFFDRIKGTGKGLNGRYDSLPDFEWDNPRGIRLASMAQHRYGTKFVDIQEAARTALTTLAAEGMIPRDQLVMQTLFVNMAATLRPQYFSARGPAGGHAVVAYGVRSAGAVKTFLLADPNQPGESGVTATYTAAGGFSPVTFQLRADATADVFPTIATFGSSTLLPTPDLDELWSEFEAGTIGDDTFPDYVFRAGDPDTIAPPIMPDPFETLFPVVFFGAECPACGKERYYSVDVFDSTGRQQNDPMSMTEGRQVLGLKLGAQNSFIDFAWREVEAHPLGLTSQPSLAFPGDTIRFVARPRGLAPPGSTFHWDFGDGTTLTTARDDSVVRHPYLTAAPTDEYYPVRLALRNEEGEVIARVVEAAHVVERVFAWSLDSAEVTGTTLPPDGIGPLRSDTAVARLIQQVLTALRDRTADNMLFVLGRPSPGPVCQAGVALQQFEPDQAVDSVSENALTFVLGSCGDPAYSGGVTMGTLGAGTLVASATDLPVPDEIHLPGGSIDATMDRLDLRGTLVARVRYSTGMGSFTVKFSATLLRPTLPPGAPRVSVVSTNVVRSLSPPRPRATAGRRIAKIR